MPVEPQSNARDNSDTYWLGHQEDPELSDATSVSSDTTTCSMSTLGSMEVSKYFRELYGRAYPADEKIPSFVPLDNGEAARLELQHCYLKLLIGSNYFGPVESVLSPDPSRRKRVLDVFTADGTWAQEMATEFPHVDFVSLDMIPLVPHAPRANITFEVYDVYNGLTEPDESFDVVHTRRTVTQIRDYPAFLREVSRVLRPGGLLLYGQIEVEVYEYTAPDKSNPTHPGEVLYPGPHVVPAQRSFPVMCHGMTLLRDSLLAQLIRVYMWRELPGLLAPESSLWRAGGTKLDGFQTQTETRQSQHYASVPNASGFRDIVTASYILPTAPWHPSPRLRAIGEIVQQIGESNWRNFGLLFRQHGMSDLETDSLIDAGLRESASCEFWQVMHYHTVYASKI